MAHRVKCRICKQTFDTDKLSKDEWIMPVKNYYYHKTCYEEWKNVKNNINTTQQSETFWYESLVDYLYEEKKMDINFSKFSMQWDRYLKTQKYTPKGMYFAIKYFIDVKHSKIEDMKNGIGIIPYIYREAAEYWTNLERRRIGTVESVVQQLEQRKNRESIVVIHNKNAAKKSKQKWNLEDI